MSSLMIYGSVAVQQDSEMIKTSLCTCTMLEIKCDSPARLNQGYQREKKN